MSSIYNPIDNQTVVNRINAITTESKAQWGTMTPDQMCKHCTAAINIAFAKQEVKVHFVMRILGKLLKNKVFNSEFRKNSPTAKELTYTDHYDLEVAKKEFAQSFALFSQGQQVIQVLDHPFWGKMSFQDWDKLMWKHADHHLKQFGV